jgi:hypothetical protein
MGRQGNMLMRPQPGEDDTPGPRIAHQTTHPDYRGNETLAILHTPGKEEKALESAPKWPVRKERPFPSLGLWEQAHVGVLQGLETRLSPHL